MTDDEHTRLTTVGTVRSDRAVAAPRDASDADGTTTLLRLATLADELGANRVSDEARELAARVLEGRFYVACLGQCKRGKSTLINALIGAPVLPVGFIPVTAVPTVARFGDQLKARIQGREGRWQEIAVSDLQQYVSEEYNPENMKGITGVEVFVPSPLLAAGMCLVDTPGLGSVFTGNTATTQAFIPHIDAALIILGADPPLAGEELALAEAVGRQIQQFILVLNKADRTSGEERNAAVSFSRKVLERHLGRPVGPIFEVSAVERLESRGPERDWGKLIEALGRLVRQSGRDLIQTACQRGVQRLTEQLLVIISEERAALERPIEESERRIRAMKETLAEAERSLRELGFLFMAEQQHLSDLLVGRHKTFLQAILPQAREEFEKALTSLPRGLGPSYRRALMRGAQDIARQHVLPWLREEQEEAEQEYRLVATRFAKMGDDFLRRVAEAGVPELARLPHELDAETGFRFRSAFTFRELIEVAQPASPLRWLADLALGLAGGRRLIENDAREFLHDLLELNCTRVQSDILNRVQESRSRLEVEIRKLLHEVSRIAELALTRARAARTAGASAVEAELARLNHLEKEVHGAG